LLYSSLNITKIIQSLNLTDAIIDDSYSKAHLASSIATTCQTKHPPTSDNIELVSFLTDANIDESCNRTLDGSNWMVCVGKSISMLYK